MSAPQLSAVTKELLTRLDIVIAEAAKPGSNTNALMAEHVRTAVTPDGEPMFTEDVLKLAVVELINLKKK